MSEDASEPIKLGSVQLNLKDGGYHECPFDRIAVGGGVLAILSVVADTQRVKAVRAALSGAAGKVTVQASGAKIRKPNAPQWDYRKVSNERFGVCPEGYTSYVHKLGYGLAHAIFVCRKDGFMPVLDDTSLWNEISLEDRFTTPLLRAWMPYVRRELENRVLIDWCQSYRCSSAFLTASTDHLDDIVSTGIKNREIEIPIPGVVDAEFSADGREMVAIGGPALQLEHNG